MSNLFELYTFPIKINDSETIAVLDIDKPYFLHNEEEDSYKLLDEFTIKNCKIKIDEKYICSKYSNDMIFNNDTSLVECIITKFKNMPTNNCLDYYNVYKFNEAIFYRIDFKKWLFVTPSEESITGSCTGIEKFFVRKIKGMGIIEINTNCKAISRVNLIPSVLYELNLNISIYDHNEDLTQLINNLEIENAEVIPQFNISLDNINTASFLKEKVKDLKSLVEKPMFEEIKHKKSTYFLLILYILIIVIILIFATITVIIYFKLKKSHAINKKTTKLLSLKFNNKFPSNLSLVSIDSLPKNINEEATSFNEDIEEACKIKTNKKRSVSFSI